VDSIPNVTHQLTEPHIRKLVRKRELLAMLPFSAATLHRKIKAGDFVHPIKLGPRITAYDLHAVNVWLAARCSK
jgi:predicted DNA-binding transcriptional regulator AlpA